MDGKFRPDKRIRKVILPQSTASECIHGHPDDQPIKETSRNKSKKSSFIIPEYNNKNNNLKRVTFDDCFNGDKKYKSKLMQTIEKNRDIEIMKKKSYPTKLHEMPDKTKVKGFTYGITSGVDGNSVADIFNNEITKDEPKPIVEQTVCHGKKQKVKQPGVSTLMKMNKYETKFSDCRLQQFRRFENQPLGKCKPMDPEVKKTLQELNRIQEHKEKLKKAHEENNNNDKDIILKYMKKIVNPI